MKQTINAIDLFCGAGGVTRGLLDAGINVLAGIDFDESVCKTYEHNNKIPFIKKDIALLRPEELVELFAGVSGKTMLAGCAPCQPFSSINVRPKENDERRTLLRYYADLVDAIKPDYVFMENVAGIARLESDVLPYFFEVLDKNGYSRDQGVVNAATYGIPQHRKRYVLIAVRGKGKVELPKGTYDGVEIPYRTVKEFIYNLPPIGAGEVHETIPNHQTRTLSELNLRRIQATPKDGGSRTDWLDEDLIPECHKNTKGFKNVYGRSSWENPAPTITTQFHAYSSGRFGHPEQDRAFSLHEGALLQTFPKNYQFFGPMGRISRQIGNAVPPRLAYQFGKYIIDY